MIPTCSISKFPHPKERKRIAKNLESWRRSKMINGKISSYGVNLIEKLDLNTTFMGEIYVNAQIFDEISTNHAVGPSTNQPTSEQNPDSSLHRKTLVHSKTHMNIHMFNTYRFHMKNYVFTQCSTAYSRYQLRYIFHIRNISYRRPIQP